MKTELSGSHLEANRTEYRRYLEYAVLGGMLLYSRKSSDLADDVLTEYPPDCWLDYNCRLAVKIVDKMRREGADINAYELGKRLVGKMEHSTEWVVCVMEKGDKIAGPAFLMEGVRTLRTEYVKEQASVMLAGAAQEVNAFTDIESIADAVRDYAVKIDSMAFGGFKKCNQVDEYFDQLEQDPAQLISTPWRGLNNVLSGGVARGELIIVGARPSVGKSAFACNWWWHVAANRGNTVFFSLEMSRTELLNRVVASLANIDSRIFRQHIDNETFDKIKQVRHSMAGCHVYIDDRGRITPSEIRKIAKMNSNSGQLDLIVVDYLQLLTPDGKEESREQEVAGMSRRMKILAKDLNVPVVVLAQLNRKLEQENREPKMSDLRESGALEQDADIILFLHNNRKVCDACAEKGMPEPLSVILAKGRNTGIGFTSLVYNKSTQRIYDMEDSYRAMIERLDRQPAREAFEL